MGFNHAESPLQDVKASVFIVDGDPAVRDTLAVLLSGEGWHAESFGSAEEFLRRPLELIPSCLMLNVYLPGASGLELQRFITTERPDIPVIFLTPTSDIATTVQAMKAGATDFFIYPFCNEELVKAVRESLERSRLAVAQEEENRTLRERYATLSTRELEVMALISLGLLNKQVGTELGISTITVKAHRGKLMRKMRAKSLADLVKMAAKLTGDASYQMPTILHEPDIGGIVGQELANHLRKRQADCVDA